MYIFPLCSSIDTEPRTDSRIAVSKLNGPPVWVFRLLVLASMAVVPFGVLAQNLLDKSFGVNGIAATRVSGSSGSKGYDAVLQPDGKIVVAGVGFNAPSFPQSLQPVVVRYNTDGTLDNSFGDDGIVVTNIPDRTAAAYAVALQTDGKIVIVGTVDIEFGFTKGFVIRYDPDGSLDPTFDGDGIKQYQIGAMDIPGDVIVQNDGKILIAEANWTSGFGGGRLITRLNADGSTDTSFGTSGLVRFPMGSASAFDSGSAMALRPDGRVVYAFIDIQSLLVQIHPDGSLDKSFGVNGVVSGGGGFSVVLQPDGKVITSARGVPNSTTVIARYNTDGSPDVSFGTNGKTQLSFPNQGGDLAKPSDIVLQPDGKIVVGGTIRITEGSHADFALARFNPDGSLDSSFGFNGRLTTDISGTDQAYTTLLQPDGKIVLAGESDAGITVARYIPDRVSLSCRPVSDFDNDGRSDLAFFNLQGDWRYTRSSDGTTNSVNWGLATDVLVPADYDGDCRTDFGVYRDGVWYVRTFGGQQSYYHFGLPGDIPVPADYDGDDLADPAVFRNGMWYVLGSQTGFYATQWGLAGDVPVPGDYDGDGREDLAIYRDGVWWVLCSTEGVWSVQFGLAGDKPVVADYDGDGRTDIAVFRPSEGVWYILKSTDGFTAYQWGISTDLPVPGDYDGDSKTDIGVYRDGTWYLLQSAAGFEIKQFGGASDRPIENAYIP